MPPDVSLVDLGELRLKDLLQPERIFQVRHPALDAEFPPLKALADRSTNLPAQTSELVGRERELREIRNLLADPSVRLMTLVGPGRHREDQAGGAGRRGAGRPSRPPASASSISRR